MAKTMYGCMDRIICKIRMQNGKLDNSCLDTPQERLREELDYVTDILGINDCQAILLSVCVQKIGFNRSVALSDICAWLGLTYMRFQTYVPDMQTLSDKWCIKINRDNEVRIPFMCQKALRENRPVPGIPTTDLSTSKIIKHLDNLFAERKGGWQTETDVVTVLDDCVCNNPDTSFARTCSKYIMDLPFYERLVFYVLCHRYYNLDDDQVGWHDYSCIIENEYDLKNIQENYVNEVLELQKRKIIDYSTDENGILSKTYFHIVDPIKAELFADLGGLKPRKAKIVDSNCIKPSDITEKVLFYNSEEEKQIATLSELLAPDRFKSIQENMKQHGLRSGFACLFYGAPGTGKTETVYQIARKTGRSLIVADVSKLKNMYVGETEKNVQALFDSYRLAVKQEELAPILLFNEADAVLGIRREGASAAVDKMENAVQNIILQEMENLNGIMIATTNLTANLDKAFERRFLYKIKFAKPSLEAKSRIWQSMIPDLEKTQADSLAMTYEFSGGQIENVTRKYMVQSILTGIHPDMEQIDCFCNEEQIDNRKTRIVGYQ